MPILDPTSGIARQPGAVGRPRQEKANRIVHYRYRNKNHLDGGEPRRRSALADASGCDGTLRSYILGADCLPESVTAPRKRYQSIRRGRLHRQAYDFLLSCWRLNERGPRGPGCYHHGAPTDPDVPALGHLVLRTNNFTIPRGSLKLFSRVAWTCKLACRKRCDLCGLGHSDGRLHRIPCVALDSPPRETARIADCT
jgi:hypothetical protein